MCCDKNQFQFIYTLLRKASLSPSSCLECEFGVLASSLTPYAASSNAASPRPDLAEASAAARSAAFLAAFSASISLRSFANAASTFDVVESAAAAKAAKAVAVRATASRRVIGAAESESVSVSARARADVEC